MSESSLASLVGTSPRRGRADSIAEPEEYQAFSFGRVGARAQLRIEFRKADGYRLVLPYVDLKSIETVDPQYGFRLQFVEKQINIEGQNLGSCYDYIKNDRLLDVIEASTTLLMTLPANSPVVTSVVVK